MEIPMTSIKQETCSDESQDTGDALEITQDIRYDAAEKAPMNCSLPSEVLTNQQVATSTGEAEVLSDSLIDNFPSLKKLTADFEAALKREAENSDAKKLYNCPHPGCQSCFDRPYRLAQHILAHNNIRPYVCNEPNCSKAYTSKSHLDRHKHAHKPRENDVVFSCPECLHTFANRQNLKRHLNTVHSTGIACEYCNVLFKKKNQLTAHLYQHTGVKAFQCDLCTDTFISLYLKKRHMRFHKMYTCTDCGVEFNHWSKYQKHKKSQHFKTDFICDECGKVFKHRTHILRHIRTHTKDPNQFHRRTFYCPYEGCERFYSKNSNLKQHILVKHMQMLFDCHICAAKLSSKAKLNYHIQLHSRIDVPGIKKPETTTRKERSDEGSFKSSTALKLSGLPSVPENLPVSKPINLSGQSEAIEVEVDVYV